MAYDQVEAIPLISQGLDGEVDYPDKSEISSGYPSSNSRRSLSTILLASALIVSLLSLCWNAFTLTTIARSPPTVSQRISVDTLRHPSIYLGLERLPAAKVSQSIASLVASASASAQHEHPSMGVSMADATRPSNPLFPGRPVEMVRVNSRYPSQRFEQDGWVLLTEDDHTIMSFNVPPGSGGRCAFTGAFPPRNDLSAQLLTLERDDGLSQTPGVLFTTVSVFDISDLSTMTWATRPPAGKALGSMVAAFGTNATTEAFACPTNTPLIVELACLGGGCRVEYQYIDRLRVEPRPFGIELMRLS